MPLDIPSHRPPADKRRFSSPCIDALITATLPQIADLQLAALFQNCFPNTLDTTVFFNPDGEGGNPDTFIITGDIDAMWLRDSTNQVWPYVPYASQCPRLQAMLRGLIHRQARCILLDPYANAFLRTSGQKSEFHTDHTVMKPGVHERKYELDSLASVLRLATGYFAATSDPAPFDATFLRALTLLVETIIAEQAGTPEQIHPLYSFARTTANALDTLPNGAHGNPCRRTGLSRSPFRPSDDACTFQYPTAGNAMASVQLTRIADLLATLNLAPALAKKVRALSEQIAAALHAHAIVTHPVHGNLFAYEIDGFGSCVLMDDANSPSLLSLPYIGFCPATDPIYQNTRKFILSPSNPYYHAGAAAAGIGSPHVGLGWIWPMSLIAQALTSIDDQEIRTCLRTLATTHADTGFIHEAFWMDNPARFTRNWFAWANTFFGELILHLARTRPHLLQESFT